MREVQVRRMVQLVTAPGVKTYCEIGMNGGHSASAMLLANPLLTVHSFDIMYWNYSWPVARLLSTTFGQRFVLHPGNSRYTVPEWTSETTGGSAAARTQPCDMILVDHGRANRKNRKSWSEPVFRTAIYDKRLRGERNGEPMSSP